MMVSGSTRLYLERIRAERTTLPTAVRPPALKPAGRPSVDNVYARLQALCIERKYARTTHAMRSLSATIRWECYRLRKLGHPARQIDALRQAWRPARCGLCNQWLPGHE